MIADNGRDYKDLPHLTTGDEDFRGSFLSWDLGNISYTDVQEYLKVKDTILVPIASFEQHGPHLPLYTDTITAVEISKRVAELIAVLHTPPLWIGYSPQHMYAPGAGRGTITLRSTTLLNLVYDVGRSLIHHGFNRIICINGHGSNVKVVDPRPDPAQAALRDRRADQLCQAVHGELRRHPQRADGEPARGDAGLALE